MRAVTMLGGNALFCHSYHVHVHVDGLVQDCGNSSALAMELLQSWIKPSMYCYRKYVLASWDEYTLRDSALFCNS